MSFPVLYNINGSGSLPGIQIKSKGWCYTMELTGIQKFRAMNDSHPNLKDCEGLVIRPVAFHTHQYTDSKDKLHTVLVILNGNDGQMYRTEVAAFIDKFMKYDESFGDAPDDEKPEITITIKTSKAGNKYVNFELLDETAD